MTYSRMQHSKTHHKRSWQSGMKGEILTSQVSVTKSIQHYLQTKHKQYLTAYLNEHFLKTTKETQRSRKKTKHLTFRFNFNITFHFQS